MKTLFEIYLRMLGYNIDNAITELNYVYSLSPKEFLDWQNKQRWLVAQYHYKNNASYQKKSIMSFHPNGKVYQLWKNLIIKKI